MVRLKVSESNLADFKIIDVAGDLLYKSYPKIKSYIAANINKDFANQLAEPIFKRLDSGNFIHWYSNQLSKAPLHFSQLPKEQQSLLSDQLNNVKAELKTYISKLKKEDPNHTWATILEALDFDEDDLFVNEDQLVIVNWALKNRFNQKSSGVFGAKQHREEVSEVSEENVELPPEIEETEKIEAFEEPEPTPPNEMHESSDKQEDLDSNRLDPDMFSNDNIEDDEETETPKKKRWLWWLLLLILLIVLSVLLLRNCSTESSVLPSPDQPLEDVLPEDVVIDDDELKYVVSDRLNIALVTKDVTLDQLAKDIIKAFPSDDIKVVQADSLTRKIQIKVNKERTQALEEEIPKKLPQYDLLIWRDNVYKHNKVFTDPGFQSSQKSWFVNAIQASSGWDVSTGNKKVVIAIIDQSFDLSHPEFAGRVVKPYNVWTRNSRVNNGNSFKHGTHVAGSAIAAANNNRGVSGICPNCSFMPITVGNRNGTMTSTSIIDGVLYAINQGADVVNLSLGMSFGPNLQRYPIHIQRSMISNRYKQEEAFWNRIFKIAEAKNVTLVLAAGNENVLAGIDPMQRNPLGIKVNAMNTSAQKAKFSNYGPYSTISAPGVQIYSSTPNASFEFLQGTSMASPLVTGAVGLMKSISPNISTKKIIEIMQTTGKPIGNSSRPIGKLLQLGDALNLLRGNNGNGGNNPNKGTNPPKKDKNCEGVQDEIQRLKDRIRELEQIGCASLDTLRLPPKIGNNLDLRGRWKSTTSIFNEKQEKVELYFEFSSNQKGLFTLIEATNSVSCEANLNVSLSNNSLNFNQTEKAYCPTTNSSYDSYYFSCIAGKNGTAECTAQNKQYKANKFNFNLIKIN